MEKRITFQDEELMELRRYFTSLDEDGSGKISKYNLN
jgi:hypothetical protein